MKTGKNTIMVSSHVFARQLRPMQPEEAQHDDKDLQKLIGKDAVHLRKHLAHIPGAITFNQAVTGIQKLRDHHTQMDTDVLHAYNWSDLNPRHNFYEVDYLPETDLTRYTLHPATRRELLKRLLKLNHHLHAQELTEGLWEKKGKPLNSSISQPNQIGLNF